MNHKLNVIWLIELQAAYPSNFHWRSLFFTSRDVGQSSAQEDPKAEKRSPYRRCGTPYAYEGMGALVGLYCT